MTKQSLSLVCISDTHNREPEIPDADVLIHAGDLTMMGTDPELQRGFDWLNSQPHRVKLLVPGNHDFGLESGWRPKTGDVRVLVDQGYEIEGVRFWGHPWVPNLPRWAFQGNDEFLSEKLAQIGDVDVLISHGPPHSVLDEVPGAGSVGSIGLYDFAAAAVSLRLVICGHIHEGYGESDLGGVHVVNASICDEYYQSINAPVVVTIARNSHLRAEDSWSR